MQPANLLNFLEVPKSDEEKQRRICVALWAWAYEKHADSLVSDAKYDEVSKKIDLTIKTGNVKLDRFFEKEFHPDTGQWVNRHPEKDKLELLYKRLEKEWPASARK